MPIRLLEPRTIAGYRYGEGTILDLQDDKEEEYLVDRAVAEWYTVDGDDALIKVNNLADLPDKVASRGNLGLGSLAIQDDVYFTVLGGVQRTVSDKLSESISVADFWDNVSTDHTSAVQAALNYAASNKVTLRVGKKAWNVTSPLTVTLSGDGPLAVIGDGNGVSVIRLDTGGDGLTINAPGNWWLFNAGGSNGVLFKDISFTTTNALVGDGIHIIGSSVQGRPGAKVLFDNVEFRGYSTMSQFWSRAVVLEDCGYAWFENPRFIMGGLANTTSIAVRIFGNAQANSPVVVNFNHPEIYYGNTAISVGDYVEGVYLTQPTIVGSVYGVQFDTTSTESGLHIVGGHINTKQKGVYVNNLFDFIVANVLFYRGDTTTANYRGIEINGAAGRFALTGSVFKGANLADGETAILCTATSSAVDFRGGMIAINDYHSFGSRAIWLGVNAHRVHIGPNSYQDCALRVLNQSSDCSADPKIYTTSLTITLTGGAATETLNITLPTGYFWTKPGNVSVMSQSLDGVPVVGQYDYNNAGTIATNAVVILRMLDGTNIPAGEIKLGVTAIENTGSGSW